MRLKTESPKTLLSNGENRCRVESHVPIARVLFRRRGGATARNSRFAFVLEAGKPVASLPVRPVDAAAARETTSPESPCELSILASRCDLLLSRMTLLRDVYYRDDRSRPGVLGGRPITLAADEYYVLGDNSVHSTDSRSFGPVPASALVGRPIAVVWPLSRLRRL